MRELYVEGVAIHDGPESCAVVREGGGEALTGVRAGRAIEPRKLGCRDAGAVRMSGKQHRRRRSTRESSADSARSENLCLQGVSMRENREIRRSPVWLITGRAAQGRLRPQA